MKERKSSGICSIFYNETNLIEKKLIISVSLMYSLMISGIIGMAFWFKDPIFLCKSESNENYYECSHDDACSSDFPFKIDSINGPDTLAVKLNLFCDRRFIKRFLLSFVFFGGFLGCLTNIIKYIGPNQRKKVFGLLGFIFAISHFSITLFSHNVSVVAISLIMISFSVMIGNAYSFMLINEFFTGDVAKVSIVLMSISCGTGGILYVVFSYLVNSNSMLLFLIMGILVFFNSFYLFFFKGPDNFKEAMSKNVKSFFFI